MKIRIAIICFLFCFAKLNAQDFHFSQFNENTTLINPAMTGVSAVFRASGVYRDQWRTITTPYRTYGLSVESRIMASNWNKVDGQSMTFTRKSFSRFAGGLSFYSDKAGDGSLSTDQLNLSFASFVPVTANSRLSLGVQGGFTQRKVDFSKLLFPDQHNGIAYDSKVASSENYSPQVVISPELAAGVNWSYLSNENLVAVNRQKKANIGVAVYHLLPSKRSFVNSNNTLVDMKYVVHADFLFGIPNSNVGMAPAFLVQLQGASKEIIVGNTFKYFIKEDSKYTGIIQKTAVNLGVFYRYGDALIFSFSYDKRQQYSIGFSYDVNLSSLTSISKFSGGPEITFRYNTANAFLYQKKPKAD